MNGLFVYGTLLAAGGQGHVIGGLPRIEATAVGRLYRMPAGYPAMTVGGGAGAGSGTGRGAGLVIGELVEGVSDGLLGLVDRYEGVHDGLYERRVIEVTARGRIVAAWAYVMIDPSERGGVLIPSGKWRSVVRR